MKRTRSHRTSTETNSSASTSALDPAAAPPAEEGSKTDTGEKDTKRPRTLTSVSVPAGDNLEVDAGGEEWNLVSRLPYVALRRLLDYLLSGKVYVDSDGQGEGRKVPEQCRLRAQCVHFDGFDVPSDIPEGEEWRYEELEMKHEQLKRKNLRKRPFAMPPFLEQVTREGAWRSDITALRLTCRTIKTAVDHALGVKGGKLTGVFAPFDRLVRSRLLAGGELPLLSDSAQAKEKKWRFSQVADLTLGTVGARLQQSRLAQVANYVWREWNFSESKRTAFNKLLEQRAGANGPLLQMEYFRHEEDFLGEQYGAGALSSLSIGLPDQPEERARIQLAYNQCWDERDEGWDLEVYIEFITASDAWKDRLSLVSDEIPQRTDELPDGTMCAALLDYDRSRGDLNMHPFFHKSILAKLAHSLGLEDASESGNKAGRDLLTVLMAILGFAWKTEVSLLWDPSWDGDDPYPEDGEPEEQFDQMTHSCNRQLRFTNRWKRQELLKTKDYIDELNALLDEHGVASTPENEPMLSLIMRRTGALLGQLRFSRATSLLRGVCRPGILADTYKPYDALRRLVGIEVANELRVVYARSLSLKQEEYSGLTDETVALALRVSSNNVQNLLPNEEHSMDAAHLLFVVSSKMGNCYNGGCHLDMISVRAIGPHRVQIQLQKEFERLAGTATIEQEEDDDEEYEEVEEDDAGDKDAMEEESANPIVQSGKGGKGLGNGKGGRGLADTNVHAYEVEGTLILRFASAISSVSIQRKVTSSKLVARIGQMLGLSLRKTDGEDEEAKRDSQGSAQDEEEDYAYAVLEFLSLAAKSACWDSEEGSFPLPPHIRERAESADFESLLDDDDESNERPIQPSLTEAYWHAEVEQEIARLRLTQGYE